jgi:addiction module HigA family antidote
MSNNLSPTHPGKILLEGIEDYKLTVKKVAEDIQVPASTLYAVTKGQRPISPELALRVGHYFNTTPEYWINLQSDYELRLAKAKVSDSLKKIPVFQAA